MSSIIPVYPLNNLFFLVHCSHGSGAKTDSSLKILSWSRITRPGGKFEIMQSWPTIHKQKSLKQNRLTKTCFTPKKSLLIPMMFLSWFDIPINPNKKPSENMSSMIPWSYHHTRHHTLKAIETDNFLRSKASVVSSGTSELVSDAASQASAVRHENTPIAAIPTLSRRWKEPRLYYSPGWLKVSFWGCVPLKVCFQTTFWNI